MSLLHALKSTLGPIQPNPTNPRTITPEALSKLRESISRDPEFMRLRPIVVDADGVVIGGNQRLQACISLGMLELPEDWVVCARDITQEQRARFILIDNSPEGLSGAWDFGALSEQYNSVTLESCGIIFPDLGDELPKDGLTDPDDAPELRAEAVTMSGDVWIMGDHRLTCGDSGHDQAVHALMVDELADMMLTDPPYNVAYEGKTSDKLTIENDSMSDVMFRDFLKQAFSSADAVMRPGAAFYIWHADSEGFNFRGACRDVAWKVRQCLVWAKSSLVLGRQDYQWQHEPCLYGWKDGAAHTWESDRKQTTILTFDKPTRNGEHPTMKPVDLFEYLIRNSTRKGEIVADFFAGSGTTVVACERNGRKARVMEIDPRYCDVIVRRWQEFTGRKAIREKDMVEFPAG